MNKIVYEGVSVDILGPVWTCLVVARPAVVLAPRNITSRVSSDVPTQTIILTLSWPVGF